MVVFGVWQIVMESDGWCIVLLHRLFSFQPFSIESKLAALCYRRLHSFFPFSRFRIALIPAAGFGYACIGYPLFFLRALASDYNVPAPWFYRVIPTKTDGNRQQ
jgi:hypothetical protein